LRRLTNKTCIHINNHTHMHIHDFQQSFVAVMLATLMRLPAKLCRSYACYSYASTEERKSSAPFHRCSLLCGKGDQLPVFPLSLQSNPPLELGVIRPNSVTLIHSVASAGSRPREQSARRCFSRRCNQHCLGFRNFIIHFYLILFVFKASLWHHNTTQGDSKGTAVAEVYKRTVKLERLVSEVSVASSQLMEHLREETR
jgi:hypothetical protein